MSLIGKKRFKKKRFIKESLKANNIYNINSFDDIMVLDLDLLNDNSKIEEVLYFLLDNSIESNFKEYEKLNILNFLIKQYFNKKVIIIKILTNINTSFRNKIIFNYIKNSSNIMEDLINFNDEWINIEENLNFYKLHLYYNFHCYTNLYLYTDNNINFEIFNFIMKNNKFNEENYSLIFYILENWIYYNQSSELSINILNYLINTVDLVFEDYKKKVLKLIYLIIINTKTCQHHGIDEFNINIPYDILNNNNILLNNFNLNAYEPSNLLLYLIKILIEFLSENILFENINYFFITIYLIDRYSYGDLNNKLFNNSSKFFYYLIKYKYNDLNCLVENNNHGDLTYINKIFDKIIENFSKHLDLSKSFNYITKTILLFIKFKYEQINKYSETILKLIGYYFKIFFVHENNNHLLKYESINNLWKCIIELYNYNEDEFIIIFYDNKKIIENILNKKLRNPQIKIEIKYNNLRESIKKLYKLSIN